ncbi:MAG: PP2C family protein-serine/threonine phosphatase [Armatimonadota bacterium]
MPDNENDNLIVQDQPVCSQISEPMGLGYNPDHVIGGVWPEQAVGPYGMRALVGISSGLGGRAVAPKASELCLDVLRERLRVECENAIGKVIDRGSTEANAASLQDILVEAFGEANGLMIDQADGTPLACSCTSAMVTGDALIWIHVGNCRLYYYRQGRMQQVTRDDYPVIEPGSQPYDADPTSNPSELTKSLGVQPEVAPSVGRVVLRPKDVILVCSDGLWTTVNDNQMRHILMNSSSCEAAAFALLDCAKERNAHDAVSLVLYCHGRWPHGERGIRDAKTEKSAVGPSETVVIRSQVSTLPASDDVMPSQGLPETPPTLTADMATGLPEPDRLATVLEWLNAHKMIVIIVAILLALALGMIRSGCKAQKPEAAVAAKPVVVVEAMPAKGLVLFAAKPGWRLTYQPEKGLSAWKIVNSKPSYRFQTSPADRINALLAGKQTLVLTGPLDGKVMTFDFKVSSGNLAANAPGPGRYKLFYKAKSKDKGLLIGRFSIAR